MSAKGQYTRTGEPLIETWVDEAIDREGGKVEDALGELVYDLLRGREAPFDRWACEDENCPGRPTWDKALVEVFDSITSEIDAAWVATVRTIVTERLTAFLKQHPDVPLREAA